MIVGMTPECARAYKSAAQRVRVISENWAEQNLFCPACVSDRLSARPRNTRAIDFGCTRCNQTFQLKAQSTPLGNRVLDGAYSALMSALRSDMAPNLFLLHYDRVMWSVINLTLVPHFAFPPSAVECRKPLSPAARRAGWVGCFIVLGRIPYDAQIEVVRDGEPVEPKIVRAQYQKLLPLRQIAVPNRGWTLEVLNLARSLGKIEFTNADIYARADELRSRYPQNRHVTDKIRQQLQVLRDTGFLTHSSRGTWRLT
jgi:type II restriction enzyme